MEELSHPRFLSYLRQRGIEITVRDGRLQISAPPGAVDSDLRAELARRKPELLKALEEAETSVTAGPLVAMERGEKIPQTHAQQGMWLIDYFSPGNVAYNIPEAFEIDGAVEHEALQKAVDALLERHETLRTGFYEEEGELLQSVSAEVSAPLGYTDLLGVSEGDRDQVLQTLMREQARRPFDLNQAPLVRFHLYRLTEQRHVVFFNIHHIIADRRSLNILKEELISLYKAVVLNQPAALTGLPLQYADYAIWATRHATTANIAGQIQYWKEKLAGAPPLLQLPFSRPYPDERTPWGATEPVFIPSALRDALAEIARQEGATMFMTLMAAFALLLSRESGQKDFCIGSPFTHRSHVETQPIIGLFVNMLVFRCELAGDPSYRELLRRTRGTALDAYEHSDVPFQELVRALKPDLRSRRSPFFQVMFGFDSVAAQGHDGVIQIDTHPGTARFDLTLHLSENPGGIGGSFEYCTDLFDAAAIQHLATEFVGLLQEVVRAPDRQSSAIELLSSSQPEPVSIPEEPPRHSGFWSGRLKIFSQRLSHRSGTE